MPEEQSPQTAENTKPPIKVEPTALSIVEFGPYSILIYNRSVSIPQPNGSEEIQNEIMLQLRRPARSKHDDITAIPLTMVPGLVMMLEEIAKTAMNAVPIPPKGGTAAPAPAAPPPPKKKQPPKKNKKR